jgi:hypothetical protein
MGAFVNQSWQGWPKVEPAWKREKEYQAKYNELLLEIQNQTLDAAENDVEALVF